MYLFKTSTSLSNGGANYCGPHRVPSATHMAPHTDTLESKNGAGLGRRGRGPTGKVFFHPNYGYCYIYVRAYNAILSEVRL